MTVFHEFVSCSYVFVFLSGAFRFRPSLFRVFVRALCFRVFSFHDLFFVIYVRDLFCVFLFILLFSMICSCFFVADVLSPTEAQKPKSIL